MEHFIESLVDFLNSGRSVISFGRNPSDLVRNIGTVLIQNNIISVHILEVEMSHIDFRIQTQQLSSEVINSLHPLGKVIVEVGGLKLQILSCHGSPIQIMNGTLSLTLFLLNSSL